MGSSKHSVIIDMGRVRAALPDRAVINISKNHFDGYYIEVFVRDPSLSDNDVETVYDWLRDIIGRENIYEFYAEETGRHWFVYLKDNNYIVKENKKTI